MQIRHPLVAGQFYPATSAECIEQIDEMLAEPLTNKPLPGQIVAGIVPHAGWVFSGQLAAMVLKAIKQQNGTVDTLVIFGAAHGYFGSVPAVYAKGEWDTPLGKVAIDSDLAEAILQENDIKEDTHAHLNEHSIEVQVPLVQRIFPDAKILPIITPPSTESIHVGEVVGQIISDSRDKKITCIGSTDLTHYGPRYGFSPMGVGPDAIKWATNINDQRFIDLAVKLEAESLLTDSMENSNACGPGAAAAAIAAARNCGRKEGLLLAHTNSNEVMMKKMGQTSSESVGYAAIVF